MKTFLIPLCLILSLTSYAQNELSLTPTNPESFKVTLHEQLQQGFTHPTAKPIDIRTNFQPTIHIPESFDVMRYYGYRKTSIDFGAIRNNYIGLGGLTANMATLHWQPDELQQLDFTLTLAKQYSSAQHNPYNVFGARLNYGLNLSQSLLAHAYAQYIHYTAKDPTALHNSLFLQSETGINLKYQKNNLTLEAGPNTTTNPTQIQQSITTFQSKMKLRIK